MDNVFSLTEAKSKFSDIINRIIYKRDKITVTKNGKRVAVIIPIEEYETYEENGLIEAKGALADSDEAVDEMLQTIYKTRRLEKSREVKI